VFQFDEFQNGVNAAIQFRGFNPEDPAIESEQFLDVENL